MLFPKLFVDNLFDDDFPMSTRRMERYNQEWMKTDVIEKEDAYELDMNLPGYKKENVKVTLNDGYLSIEASTQSENNEEKEGQVIRKERFSGTCSRSFYVGKNVTKEDIKAKFENGVLHLTVPKVAKKELPVEHTISIE